MEYKCKICVKEYSSYKSLWNHNKKFHKPVSAGSQLKVSKKSAESQQQVKTVLDCKYCNKSYNHKQSRWRHEKICKIKNTAIIKQESKETKETNITYNINKGVINNKVW